MKSNKNDEDISSAAIEGTGDSSSLDEAKLLEGEALSLADIMSSDDKKIVKVAVPEWGGFVFVKALSGKERDAFEASMLKGAGKQQRVDAQNVRAKLCSLAICDAKGVRLFATKEAIDALGTKSASALSRVYKIASELSGVTEDDVEELVKNSGKGQFDDLS